MAEFTRIPERFNCRGIQLSKPADQLDPGKFPYLQNLIPYADGRISPRPGLEYIADVPGSPHSIRRLNDIYSNDYTLVVGASSKVVAGKTGLLPQITDMLGSNVIGDGWSVQPLSMIPYRPERSSQSWMYISDINKMAKIRIDGKAANIGIAPPLNEPKTQGGQPTVRVIENCQQDPPFWLPGGNATAITAVATIGQITADFFVYDNESGLSPGYCSASVVTTDPPLGIGVGQILTLDFGGPNEEAVFVTDVLRAPLSSQPNCTIQRIIYDSTGDGTGTGYASVVPSVPISDMVPRSLIIFDSGGGNEEKLQILSTAVSPDGVTSFRVFTTANHVAAEAITGVSCLRFYTLNTQVGPGNVVVPRYYFSGASGAGISTLTLGVVADYTYSDTPIKRQIQLADDIHITLFFSEIARFVEGKVMIDVDSSGAGDFSRNFYYYAFKPNDLVPAADSSQTITATLSAAQTNAQIDNTQLPTYVPGQMAGAFQGTNSPQPTVGQMIAGDAQWCELRFKVSDLVRVGSDNTRGLSDVQAVRLQFETNDLIEIIAFGSFWMGGTYGPDSGQFGLPFYYAYRSRQPETGARSLLSPPTRIPLPLHRQKATITMEHQPDPQVDSSVGGVLDVFRFGGDVTKWQYVGSTPNTAGNPQFDDTLTDESVLAADPADEDVFQPFPTQDILRTGTCNVSGTTVVRTSGDFFNLYWAPGTEILINGTPYTLFSQPELVNAVILPPFANFLEIQENAGDLTDATWEITGAQIMGQPLQCIFGPFPETQQVFGCGDARNPGRLYWTNPNNPDGADDVNWKDVTTSSEPLMNGGMYRDTATVLFSTERLFRIYRGQDERSPYVVAPVVTKRGLFAKWGMAFGPLIWYIAKDGIYATDASPGDPASITDDDLYPLFPHAGYDPPTQINGVEAPDFTRPDDMRLGFDGEWLRFTYVGKGGPNNRRQLFYHPLIKAWFYNAYPDTRSPILYYGEEPATLITTSRLRVIACCQNSTNGVIASVEGGDDITGAITCKLFTRAQNGGDFRVDKLWGDYNIDLQGNLPLNSITAQVYIDTLQAALPAQTFSAPSQRALQELKTNSGVGTRSVNFGLMIQYDAVDPANGPHLFGWECQASPYPIDLLALKTIAGTHNLPEYQHVREFYPSLISTTDLSFDVTVDGVSRTYLVPSTAGEHLKPRISLGAVKGKMFSYRLYGDATTFKFFPDESEIHVGIWAREGPYEVIRPFGPSGP